MTTVSASSAAAQSFSSSKSEAKSGAPKQRLLYQISAQQQAGSLSATDASALTSAAGSNAVGAGQRQVEDVPAYIQPAHAFPTGARTCKRSDTPKGGGKRFDRCKRQAGHRCALNP